MVERRILEVSAPSERCPDKVVRVAFRLPRTATEHSVFCDWLLAVKELRRQLPHTPVCSMTAQVRTIHHA